MKRQLTKEEKILIHQGLARIKKEIARINEHLVIYTERKAYLKAKANYELLALPFQARIDLEENDKFIEKIHSELENNQKQMEILNDQLKNGVEQKETKQKPASYT